MIKEKKYILTLSEYRNFVDFIKERYNFDLSFFEVLITKRRIENFFYSYNISDYQTALNLIDKTKFWGMLQDMLLVPTTELFRDADTWAKLKNKVLLRFKNFEPTIWLPDITSDDELDTLLVVLNEAGFENNFKVIVSSPFEKIGDMFQNNGLDDKKFETAKINYRNYNEKGDLDSYFNYIRNSYYLRKDLYINVVFKKYAFWEDQMPENYFDMVVCRNRLLYYTPEAHKKYLEKIYKSLKTKGTLVLGINETFAGSELEKNFNTVEKNCQIFIKKR